MWRSVTVDEAGVQVGTDRLAWSEITDYSFTVDPKMDAFDGGWADVRDDMFDMTLYGKGKQLRICSRFDCREVLRRLEPRFHADAEERLARGETVAFGPLYIGPEMVEWLGKDKKKLRSIEQADLFHADGKTLFRIITRGKAWPFVSENARKVPRARVALLMLKSLGVKVEIPEYFIA